MVTVISDRRLQTIDNLIKKKLGEQGTEER